LTVRLIATLGELKTVTVDAQVSEALTDAKKYRFDYLPVRRPADGLIIGVFDAHASYGNSTMQVGKIYEPIGPNDLISAETSLLNFVYSADQQPRRLVLDGTKIEGIVTLSDIQKLPVRMALFCLFIHFELLLSDHLRQMLGGADPCAYLSLQRAERVRNKWQEFYESELNQDMLDSLDLCDKRDIAKKLNILGKSTTEIESSIKGIEKHLRNPIAHGAEYAHNRKSANKTIRAARSTREWIQELQAALRPT